MPPHTTGERISPAFRARAEAGRAARDRAPRSSHAAWAPPADRADPVALLEAQAAHRTAELIPVRYGRMKVSAFTFFRGNAAIMAADLAGSPDSGITVQLCGDAHLSNFGLFGTPERSLIFDINDFDETLPGPWEWDVKRLAASVEVAGRSRGFTPEERREVVRAAVRGYRERMRRAAAAPVLTAWYDRLDADQVLAWVREEERAGRASKALIASTARAMKAARKKDSGRAFAKLVEIVDGHMRLRADPPLLVPLADLAPPGRARTDLEDDMRALIAAYRTTLSGQRHPLDDFEFVDMARKVSGVGSVGLRTWVVLLRGRGDDDPLILQAKEAQASVLEEHLPGSEHDHHGARVVRGQRAMQAASDIFLGWKRSTGFDGVTRDFYVRQFQDWKGSAAVDRMAPYAMKLYARICGETLARAHARSGDRVAIAAYLGRGKSFDRALADFADAYATQNEQDYAAFCDAVASGRLTAADVE